MDIDLRSTFESFTSKKHLRNFLRSTIFPSNKGILKSRATPSTTDVHEHTTKTNRQDRFGDFRASIDQDVPTVLHGRNHVQIGNIVEPDSLHLIILTLKKQVMQSFNRKFTNVTP